MAKLLDYFSLTVTLFLLTFVWSALAFDSTAGALIFSCAFTLIAVVTVRYVKSKKGKPYPYDRLALELSIRGSAYQIKLMKSIIKNDEIKNGENYILLQNSIFVAAYKFSALGLQDLSSIVNLCEKHGRNHAFVLARGIDRRAYAVTQATNVRVSLIKIKAFYKLLEKNSALPDLKPVKRKFSVKAFFETALSRSNLRAYLFSGAVLVLVSFITPLKIYYIAMGSVSLLLAILTLTPLGNGGISSPKLADELALELPPSNDDEKLKR